MLQRSESQAGAAGDNAGDSIYCYLISQYEVGDSQHCESSQQDTTPGETSPPSSTKFHERLCGATGAIRMGGV